MRTDKERRRNVRYQVRLYKKRRLFYAATKFMLRLYHHRPPGMQPAHIRYYVVRLMQVFNLPYNWNDKDLQRAYNTLRKLEKEAYKTDYLNYSNNYQALLTAVLEPLQNFNGSVEDRAKVVAAAMLTVGMEINALFGNKKPKIKDAVLFILTLGQPYAKWVSEAIVDCVLEHFRPDECVEISNLLYEKLTKILSETTATILSNAEEEQDDEMEIDFSDGKGGKNVLSN